jgi:hypothetical protein
MAKRNNTHLRVAAIIERIKNDNLIDKLIKEMGKLPKCRKENKKGDDVNISQARDRAL